MNVVEGIYLGLQEPLYKEMWEALSMDDWDIWI